MAGYGDVSYREVGGDLDTMRQDEAASLAGPPLYADISPRVDTAARLIWRFADFWIREPRVQPESLVRTPGA